MYKLYLFLFIGLNLVSQQAYASVAQEVNQANRLYKHGQFDEAIKFYQKALDNDQNSSVVKYDLGTALYKKGDYAKALEYLQQSAQDKNAIIKKRAEYNLGNAFYKSGIQKANTNVDQAIKSLQEALGAYGQALSFDSKDVDASFNEDFVKKEIERLKHKKQEQQQNQQQQQNQKKQQQDQKNKEAEQNQQKNKQNQHSQNNQKQKNNNQKEQGAHQQQSQKNQKQSNSSSKHQESQKELDRKQAEDLLEDYQQNEEPKKLLNYMPKKIDDRPVLKDW